MEEEWLRSRTASHVSPVSVCPTSLPQTFLIAAVEGQNKHPPHQSLVFTFRCLIWMWALSNTKPLSLAVNVGQTFPNLFIVCAQWAAGWRRGGWPLGLRLIRTLSSAHDAVQGRLSSGQQERSCPLIFVVLLWFSAVFFAGVELSWPPLLWWKQSVISLCCVCASVFLYVFLGAWTFLWFVCFCLLASQWGRTQDIRGIPMDAPRAIVAFSFFSMATWVSGAAPVPASTSFIEDFRVAVKTLFIQPHRESWPILLWVVSAVAFKKWASRPTRSRHQITTPLTPQPMPLPPTTPRPTPRPLTQPIPATCLTCSSLLTSQTPNHKETAATSRPATESKGGHRQRGGGVQIIFG